MILNKKKYLKYPYGGNLSYREQADTDYQKTMGVASAIPVYGQAIQGFGAIGKGIGNQTTNNDGLYKSKGAEVLDNMFNPATGISNIKSLFSGKMSAKNFLNFSTQGMLGESYGQQKILQENKSRQDNEALQRANLTLSNYDTTGSNQNNIYAKFGGKVPLNKYMIGGNLNTLANNRFEVNGRPHSEGGVKDPINGVELEGGETGSGDYIFSKTLGFADKHRKLISQMGKIEKKSDRISRQTLDFLKSKESSLKNQQEAVRSQLGLNVSQYEI